MSPLATVLALLGFFLHQPVEMGARTASGSDRAVWPLEPRPTVAALFDPPEADWHTGHRGVDLVGSTAQVVKTALAGTISFAGSIAGRGVVVVSHGTQRTTYEPVLATVKAGQQVATGAAIGTLQNGPSHCAPRTCLHWGLRQAEHYLDPMSLLEAGPIRLLPLD